MIHNFKLFALLLVASIGSLIVIGAPTAHAQGEKWELTSKTTIVVSGGVFNGKNGNPSSLTLTTKSTATDPVIWTNSKAFTLKDINGLPLEDRGRAAGEFCVKSNNTPSLLNNRTSVGFSPIVRGDCGKGAQARYVDQSAGTNTGVGVACASGTFVIACNGIWNTKGTSYVTPSAKIVYAIPGAPLKCGDIGFVGPCQDDGYATKDCTKTDGTPGQSEKCLAVQGCIITADKAQADCLKGWDACIASYTDDPGAGYNACKTAVSKGDFEGGKYIADADPTSESTCKVDGVGWIVCPVTNLMANIVDAAYGFVGSLLVVQPLLTTGNTAGIYSAWSVMRNFANVAFVIAFIIIIYSQLTGAGINNYGIKKMLPRIIIAAILVNVSYWICAIAVDLSNILGGSINGLFQNGVLEGIQGGIPNGQNETAIATGKGWAGIAGLVLAGGAAVGIVLYVGLAALLPALIAALLAIVTVFLVLTLRQALIILLIVIAPLAFVAYLLPNTEGLFKKWRQLFQTLLLMYPIIAFLFGASALASYIVMNSAEEGDYKVAIQIMGALIAILPLAITPLVMKTAGGVLNRFGGLVNNPNRGPFDRMRKGAEGVKSRAAVNRGLRAMDPSKRSMLGRAAVIRGRNKRAAVASGRADQFKDMQAEEIAKMATSGSNGAPSKFAQQVAGDKANVYAAKQASYLANNDPVKLELEVDKAQLDNAVGDIRMKISGMDASEGISEMKKSLMAAYDSNDSIGARAAQQMLMTSGSAGVTGLRDTLKNVDPESGVGQSLRRELASSGIKSNAADVHAWATQQPDSVTGKRRSLDEISKDQSVWGKLSDANYIGQNTDSIKAAQASGELTPEMASRILANPSAAAIGGAERKMFESIAAQNQPSQTNSTNLQPQVANQQTPATSRTGTPANTSGYVQSPTSGLIVPPNINVNVSAPAAAPTILTVDHSTPPPRTAAPAPQPPVSFNDSQGRATPGQVNPNQATDYHDRMSR